MKQLPISLAVLLLSACGGLAVDQHAQVTASTTPPLAFPDQKEPPRRGSLEEMMSSHADVLKVAPNNTVLLKMQSGQLGIHPHEEDFDIFVIQLLRSLQKYEGRGISSGLTLQDIPAVTLTESDQSIVKPGLAELAGAYRDVLATTSEPGVRLQVQQRLADIMLLQGEAALAGLEAGDGHTYFAESISIYTTLLREHPEYPSNEELLYQLAKAYAFNGQSGKSIEALDRLSSGYPASPHVPEADFRRAENYFAAADDQLADLAYTRVIGYGEATPYYTNALYMQGWSRLKKGDYASAIEPFTATLDRVMPADNNMQVIEPSEQELAQDCLRALAVVFSQLNGAESIAQAYHRLGPRSYEPLVYSQLGDLYLAQERYADSAEAYKLYLRGFPGSSEAPRIQMRVIEAYEAGGFPALVVQEKQAYLERFGPGGEYWLQSGETQRGENHIRVQQFMQELAQYHHALAQQQAEPDGQPAAATEHYQAAIHYYRSFIDNFPEDTRVPTTGFLLGECQFEVGDFTGAIGTYERVAYDFGDSPQAADAAYAAILAYEQLGREISTSIDQQRIASERRFAAIFDTDPRALPVLEHAAASLLKMDEFELSAEVSATVIDWQPAPDASLLTAARLVLGHSLFELEQYGDAEQAYREVLLGLAEEDERYPDTVNRLAASIYQQGEAAAGAGEYLEAATQFQRVISSAPLSPIRVNAQFDAATNYIEAGELAQANALLLDFRSRFPEHELVASIGTNLVNNYEQMEMWQAAAAELDTIAAGQPQEERQRQALYLSASYYDRAGATELAIQRYQRYADGWAEPFDTQLEAMYRLAQLYQQTGEARQQRSWLTRIITAHDQAGSGQSERSVYLAALSASVLAQYEYDSFSAIKLAYPIKSSLDRKRTAMQRAVAAYQKTEAYGVQQFSTQATYRIGRIYQQLGADLLDSDRPDNLDPMALEQYEVLLEEQAYPFEEKAIAIYEANTQRSRQGTYDEWVRKSFNALGELLPARYHKLEKGAGYSGEIY
jgi:TolA-binding protein